jgi:hypothetical protein
MITIADRTSELCWDEVWNGKQPSKMYVAFVTQAAVNRNYVTNPFNFDRFNLS